MQMLNYRRYNDVLNASSGPKKRSDFPNVTADYRGLIAYAKNKGVAVTELTQEEKDRFVKPKNMDRRSN